MTAHIIRANALAELLADIEGRWQGSSVTPNDARNLAVLDASGAYVGYIDLGIGAVEVVRSER